jgi:transcriptional regulator with XRE-family HTH domain
MVLWRSAGDVLRWWRRDVLGWTQLQAADALNVRANALSNWERGERTTSLDVSELDKALKGEGVLEGLMWSYGTPEGLDPGRVWTKVFPGESRPVWLWLRAPVRRLVFEAEWGVARMETELELGPNGVFVTVGASLPDSPVVIHLPEPGWADFGYGALPRHIPGAPSIAAVTMLERSSAAGPVVDMLGTSLEAKLSSGWRETVGLAEAAPGAVDSYAGRGRREPKVPRVWPVDIEGIDSVERQRFARLRAARGLSLAALSERLMRQTGLQVGRDTLRRFETDVGEPHDPMLPVALDHALGAAGRLALLELRSGAGDGSVRFPGFWRGPIWLRFDDTGGPRQVVLGRKTWQREVAIDGPTSISAHWFDPTAPIRIRAPASTSWSVGVGRLAGALAANQGWVPSNVDVAKQAVTDIEDAFYSAVDRRHDR